MSRLSYHKAFSRRDFLKIGGMALAGAAGAYLLPQPLKKTLAPEDVAQAADRPPDLFFAGTDGWIYLPPNPPIPPFHPDTLGPAPFNTYIFGFRNLTGLTGPQIAAQKMKAQHTAPMFWVNQYSPALGNEFHLALTNLGLAIRPDLTDAHTIHWHGFRDAIPYFDGEPHGSVSVPVGKVLTYVYRPRDPGTYMFHCHVEDVEHVHMGMAGMVFVRPAQDGNTALYPSGKFAYNDGDGSTGFDREFAMMLTEVWAEAHWADAHIQLPEWSDYRADFGLLNGRVYPDTLAPNGPIDPFVNETDANGDLIAPSGHPELQYQPISSLVRANAGERVLLRFASLGYMNATMVLTGIPMHIVGKDATPMRGRDGTNTSFVTSSLQIYPGASYDAIFTAPPFDATATIADPELAGAVYNRYLLYNRAFKRSNNLATGGFGGQATEVRVYQPGTLGPQTLPNT